MDGLKEILKERYIKKFLEYMSNESGDRSGLRTSDITSECLRRCYWNYVLKGEVEYDLITQNIFFLGHCYHKILISNVVIKDKNGNWDVINDEDYEIVENKFEGVYNVLDKRSKRIIGIYGAEVPVRYKNLVEGRLDELYYDEKMDEVILIDKKTVTKFPKEMYNHYKKQISYYLVMLRDTFPKLEVNKCCLLYVKNSSKYSFDVSVSEIIEIDVDAAEEELKGKCELLWSYIKRNEIPPASPSEFECRFCPYKNNCDAYEMFSIGSEKLDKYISGKEVDRK